MPASVLGRSANPMILTRFKEKLSKHLSYPIGAEALTEGLAGAPHVEFLALSFWGHPFWPNSRFQVVLAEHQPYKVLAARYWPAHKLGYGGAPSLMPAGYYDEQWELTVYPVVRELRQLANRLLRERGLPLLVQWLRSSERAGWMSRSHEFELVFSPAEELLAARESSGV
jgi:hypothetical protein